MTENMYAEPEVKPRVSIYTKYIKRMLDIILCLLALIVLSPVLFITAVLEVIFQGLPVLYCSARPGLYGVNFNMYKFRSMSNAKDENGELLPDAERLTAFGRFIRKWSIDELPELINVIKGDMSIIGPRPLLCKYMEFYSPRHKMRHCVRPGLCCIRADKNKVHLDRMRTWGEQFEDDIFYVENVSFSLDVKMVFTAVYTVFKHEKFRENASRAEFDGTNLNKVY
ncbi:MAG: sugar transferase [Clostridiales bacterium]|nr:sugar transferase [Clostridiales bacterium]